MGRYGSEGHEVLVWGGWTSEQGGRKQHVIHVTDKRKIINIHHIPAL